MSVTGGLLAYERQIIAWADTREYAVAPPSAGAPRLSIEAIIANVSRSASRGRAITTVTVRADSGAPVSLAAGPRTLFVNPYTGLVMGEGAPGVRALLPRGDRLASGARVCRRTAPDRPRDHRRLQPGVPLHHRQRHLLWWPRTRTRRQLRSITMFNGSLHGKARDFNWHNVIGFWSAIPLFVIVLGSAMISYPWASDLVYRLVGEAPPAPSAAAALATLPRQRPERPWQCERRRRACGAARRARRRRGSIRCWLERSSRSPAGAASAFACRPPQRRRSSSPSTAARAASRTNAGR